MAMELTNSDDKFIDFLKNDNKIISVQCIEKERNYRFFYNSDDCKVVGYVSFPVGFEFDKKYKLIIYNRGGGDERGKLQFVDLERFSCLGYIAVGTQYRSSDGGIGGKDEFGGEDVVDITNLLDLIYDWAFIDKDNIFMTGMSRGGMMTYMIVKNEKRIKAIAVVSGVADLTETWQSRPEFRKVLISHIGVTLDEDRNAYIRRSAVYWADKINVPVFIIHSNYDKSVSVVQAKRIEKLLEENNSKIKSKYYDDDIHGFHEGDANNIIEWFNNL